MRKKSLTRRGALPYILAVVTVPAATAALPQAATAIAIAGHTPHGYGRCSQCACPGYSGNQNVCQNCGHNYQTHW